MNHDEQAAASPAPHPHFEIQIDRTHYTVTLPQMTGLQLRHVPTPPIGPDRDLFEVVPGGSDKKIGDGRDQLQTPQSDGDFEETLARDSKRTSGEVLVVSVNACSGMHHVLSVRAWHSSFYANPATPEAITWLRATATIRG